MGDEQGTAPTHDAQTSRCGIRKGCCLEGNAETSASSATRMGTMFLHIRITNCIKVKKTYINNTYPYDISPETHRSKVRCDKGKWHIPPQYPPCLVHFLGTCFLGKGAQFEKNLRLFPFFRLTKIKSRHTLNFTYIQYTHNTNGKDGFIHEDPR